MTIFLFRITVEMNKGQKALLHFCAQPGMRISKEKFKDDFGLTVNFKSPSHG